MDMPQPPPPPPPPPLPLPLPPPPPPTLSAQQETQQTQMYRHSSDTPHYNLDRHDYVPTGSAASTNSWRGGQDAVPTMCGHKQPQLPPPQTYEYTPGNYGSSKTLRSSGESTNVNLDAHDAAFPNSRSAQQYASSQEQRINSHYEQRQQHHQHLRNLYHDNYPQDIDLESCAISTSPDCNKQCQMFLHQEVQGTTVSLAMAHSSAYLPENNAHLLRHCEDGNDDEEESYQLKNISCPEEDFSANGRSISSLGSACESLVPSESPFDEDCCEDLERSYHESIERFDANTGSEPHDFDGKSSILSYSHMELPNLSTKNAPYQQSVSSFTTEQHRNSYPSQNRSLDNTAEQKYENISCDTNYKLDTRRISNSHSRQLSHRSECNDFISFDRRGSSSSNSNSNSYTCPSSRASCCESRSVNNDNYRNFYSTESSNRRSVDYISRRCSSSSSGALRLGRSSKAQLLHLAMPPAPLRKSLINSGRQNQNQIDSGTFSSSPYDTAIPACADRRRPSSIFNSSELDPHRRIDFNESLPLVGDGPEFFNPQQSMAYSHQKKIRLRAASMDSTMEQLPLRRNSSEVYSRNFEAGTQPYSRNSSRRSSALPLTLQPESSASPRITSDTTRFFENLITKIEKRSRSNEENLGRLFQSFNEAKKAHDKHHHHNDHHLLLHRGPEDSAESDSSESNEFLSDQKLNKLSQLSEQQFMLASDALPRDSAFSSDEKLKHDQKSCEFRNRTSATLKSHCGTQATENIVCGSCGACISFTPVGLADAAVVCSSSSTLVDSAEFESTTHPAATLAPTRKTTVVTLLKHVSDVIFFNWVPKLVYSFIVVLLVAVVVGKLTSSYEFMGDWHRFCLSCYFAETEKITEDEILRFGLY